MRVVSWLLAVLVFVILVSGFSSPSFAQSPTATISGRISDPKGLSIPGAKVQAVNIQTNVVYPGKTNSEGFYTIELLPPGNYRVIVQKEGFAEIVKPGIELHVQDTVELNFSMQIGSVAQRITVQGGASPVETTTGTLSNIVDQRQMVDLPLNGRDPATLVLLAAGVSNPAMNTANSSTAFGVASMSTYPVGIGGAPEQQGAILPVVGGIRSGAVYFSLDGVTNENPFVVSGGPFPNPDAVQEFRVMTNGYGAEYPSAPGGAVNIVTKSGTNEFHGNVFEFLRNGDLNARNYFAVNTDNIKRNQFGFTAGGPIRKDKFFIFGSYQGTTLRNDVGGNISFVPTAAEREGDFSAIPTQIHDPSTGLNYAGNQIPMTDFNSISNVILSHIPEPTGPNGMVNEVVPASQGEQQFTVKSDYQLGKQSFVVRYFYADTSTIGNVNNPNWLILGGPSSNRWQDAMVGHNYASGRMVNEARFTFQRNFAGSGGGLLQSWKDLGANVSAPPGPPYIQLIDVSGYFGIGGGTFLAFPSESFTASDRLTIIRGRHQISLGGDVQRIDGNVANGQIQSGVAIWAPLPPFPPVQPFLSFSSGNILSDLVLGRQTIFVQGDGMLARPRGTLYGLFGTDQIRVAPRLTVTLGMRWDPYWAFHTLHGRASCFRPGEQSTVFINAPTGLVYPGDPGCSSSGGVQSDLLTFQPRIGFAYRLDQKGSTSIRGGYGIYAMQFPMQSFLPFSDEPPYLRSVAAQFSPGGISNPWVAGPEYPGGDPFAGGFRANDQPLPSNTAFPSNLSLSVFSPNWKLASVQQWNLTLEHLFWGSTLVAASYVGTKGTHLSLNRDINAAVYIPGQCAGVPCSTTANEIQREPYPALASVIDNEGVGNSSYNSLQLVAQRRISTGLTLNSNFTWSKAIDTVSSNANGTLYSGFNTVSDPFNLTAYRGLSDDDLSYSAATSFVWQLPTSRSESFVLKRVLSHWMASGIWLWQGGMPFSVFSGVDNSLTGVGLDYADFVPGVSPKLNPDRPHGQLTQEYFNVAAFQQNATGTFGNSGRNILRGPGSDNVDFALMKLIPLKSEKRQLMVRGEFFNIMNTPHFDAPAGAGGSLITPEIGQILAARDPRIIQLALKLNW